MNLISLPRVLVEPNVVEETLVRLFGLSLGEFREVARATYRGFVGVSALHPKGFNGTTAWADGSAALRQVAIPKGWKPDDPNNQPRIISQDGRTSITVSSGDQLTGTQVEGRDPQTRNDKGTQTAQSVFVNPRQGQLFPALHAGEKSKVVPIRTGDKALWVLLYYIDLDAQEVRSEISLPSTMSENDKICGWSHRLILPSMEFGAVFNGVDSGNDLPDIDILVSPKTT